MLTCKTQASSLLLSAHNANLVRFMSGTSNCNCESLSLRLGGACGREQLSSALLLRPS
jgi:hypothetical protein